MSDHATADEHNEWARGMLEGRFCECGTRLCDPIESMPRKCPMCADPKPTCPEGNR